VRDPDRFAVEVFLDLVVEAFREPCFAVDRLAVDFREADDLVVGRLVPAFLVLERLAADFREADVFVVGRLVPAFLVLERLAADRLALDDLRLCALRPPAFAAFVLIFSETSSACATATASILSATVPTRSCAASVESSFLPAFRAVSVTPSFAMGSSFLFGPPGYSPKGGI
jgi:hypothetical protein